MTKDLEALSVLRKDWVESNRKNGFEEGITNLLTQLYPDNAHFIYELLQNAEDPRATSVKFKVTKKSLEFEHNGERLFDINDIESITSIGKSTKKDDPTSIGKFGVGFKAVFAYTNTPEIHSGKFSFRIRDLVVPQSCDVDKKVNCGETKFIFPFDNPSKSPGKALEEIERGLRSFSDSTLLFLSHIRSIKYELHDGASGSLERVEHDDGRTEIIINHPDGKNTSSNFLIFDKDVSIIGEDEREKICRIAIAYALEEHSKKDKKDKSANGWLIKAVHQGQVSIFFPAEKETSNLHFHIHAPFASTVARDSIRDCYENNILRDCIAELVVESLHEIRDKGMLSLDFLGILPNDNDNISDFYDPIRQAIINEFNTQSLTPTKMGGYAPASELYRGPVKISSVLDDDDIAAITDYKKPFWVANPRQKNQREDQFLESLRISLWDWAELSCVFNPDEDESLLIHELVRSKDDQWVQSLYSLLGELFEEGEYIDVEGCRIVRVNMDGKVAHVEPSQAFLPCNEEDSRRKDLPEGSYFVKKETYFNKKKREYAVSFLEHIGVNEFNARAIIELELKDIESNPPSIDDDSYFKKIKKYIAYWKDEPSEAELFKKHSFLFGRFFGEFFFKGFFRFARNDPKKLFLVEANYIALGSDYEDTGLDSAVEVHKKHILWEGYAKKFINDELKDFISFVKAIGVMFRFEVVRSQVYYNPNRSELWKDCYRTRKTQTGINEDYTIEGLIEYIEEPSVPISRMIWNCLVQAKSKCAKARYRPNQQYPTREAESQLVCNLKKYAWIPDKNGGFKKPEDMTHADLRPDFVYDDNNGLLTAIGFGDQEKKRSSEYYLKDKAARDAGFADAEEQEKWRMLKDLGISVDDLLAQYKQPLNDTADYELPERSSGKSSVRQKRLAEEADNAPERVGEKRTRTIQSNKPIVKEEARLYLKDNYTNFDDSMICQICKTELPFRQRDGSYYFEAVEFFPDARKFHPQNYLSLCPNHAAMFKLVNDSESIESELTNLVDEVELPIVLAGEDYSIYFTERHLEDLKTILSVDGADKNSKVEISVSNDERKEITEELPSHEAAISHKKFKFPTGFQEWKKCYIYERIGEWVLATSAGLIVARFSEKSDAQIWWDKFSEHRGILPVPPLIFERPKLKLKANG